MLVDGFFDCVDGAFDFTFNYNYTNISAGLGDF